MERSRPLLRDLNAHLICTLCGGYFIDATTIVECLHSFCRSCVVRHLETSKFCPICDVQVHKTKPLSSIRRDPTLQTLVYKIVPGLYQAEQKRRRDFEIRHQLPQRAESPGAILSPEDSVSLQLRYHDDPAAPRRYLRCPAAVSVRQLQRFVRLKYGLVDAHRVDVIYQGECLPPDFTLIDVAYTFAWKRTSPMQFTYRIFDCAPDPKTEPTSVAEEPSLKKARVEDVVPSEPDPPPPAPPAAPSVAPSQPKDPVETKPKAEPEKPTAASSSSLLAAAAAAASASLPSVASPVASSPSTFPPGTDALPSAAAAAAVATSSPTPAKALVAVASSCPAAAVVPEKPVETKACAATFAPESIADDFNEDDDDDDEFTLRISSSEEEEQQPEPAPEPEPLVEPQPEPEPEPDPVPESEPAPTVPRGSVDDDAEGRRSKSDAGRSKARQKEERKRNKHKSKHHQRGEDGVKKRKTHRGDIAVTPTILQYDEDAIKLKVKLSSPTSPSTASSSTSNHHKHHHHHHHSKHHHSRHHKQSEAPANGEPAPAERERLAPRPKGDRGDVLMPPSTITVSKVDPADRRKGETKRPALEITLVNAPKKACPTAATSTTSNATSALRPPAGLTITPKIQPPKKDEQAMRHDDIGALDLSGKSSRTHSVATPESTAAPAAKTTQQSILSIAHTLVHRQLQGMAMAGQNGSNAPATPALSNLKTLSDAAVHIRNMMAAQGKANGCVGPRPPASRSPFGPLLPAAPSSPIRIPVPPKTAPRAHELYSKAKPGPGPNQAVRHIPNPSALVFRQQPYQASSIRKMENMTRNIEKVAAGLQMRAVEANVTK